MIWLVVGLLLLPVVGVAVWLFRLHLYIFRTYIPFAVRIFTEKPLFIIPFGKPNPDAEEVALPTSHNLTLRGCYFKTPVRRKGVILFGLEFGSNRWSCQPYCDFLLEQGYDIFSFEMRGQGDSPAQPGYEPLQWVTDFEVEDFRAALAYLKRRPDADPRGVGFFGLSKGAGAGLTAAAADPTVRCAVTDGMFGTFTTMVPYMQKWIFIYAKESTVANFLPLWYYRFAGRHALKKVSGERHCHFTWLEKSLGRFAPRPLLMIHGGADNYIKPEMAQALFDTAQAPKELWLVEGAKHNQAINTSEQEYKRRILAFFDQHLTATTAAVATAGVLIGR